MSEFIKKLQVLFDNLPFPKKMALFALFVLAIAGAILVTVWANKPDYQVLYSNLSIEDSGEIITRLKQRKIPYSLSENGRVVMVPAKDVYEMRMEMAGEGIPQGGGVGFEIFDKTKLGVSDFVQKLNYKRALQGELSRTITQLEEVESSRVHIVTPERSLFVEDQKKTTASVMLKLKGGKRLKYSQVQGIVHLVASSIEGLDPLDITVVDVHGEVLYGGNEGSDVRKLSSNEMEYKKAVETDLETRVQSMLEKVLGTHSSIVRVTAELDFQRVEKTEENFDPNSQVARSEQRSEESSSGGGEANIGVSGVGSNVPGGSEESTASLGGGKSQKTRETINYEINKVIRKVTEPTGNIKTLSVAVVIDGTYDVDAEGKKTYKPRTENDITAYDNIVKTAVGFNEARGDKVKIENMQFKVEDMTEEEEALKKEAKYDLWFTIGRYALSVVAVIIIFLFIIKPIMSWIKEPMTGIGTTLAAEGGGGAGGEMGGSGAGGGGASGRRGAEVVNFKDTLMAEKGEYRKRVQDIASSEPKMTAEVIRNWVKKG